MTDWNKLLETSRELSQAFNLLDRANEITLLTTAALITKAGLLDAARDTVARANRMLGRPQ